MYYTNSNFILKTFEMILYVRSDILFEIRIVALDRLKFFPSHGKPASSVQYMTTTLKLAAAAIVSVPNIPEMTFIVNTV